MRTWSFKKSLLIYGAAFLIYNDKTAATPVDCLETSECNVKVGTFSECIDGFCSNPYQEGCLFRSLPTWKKKRVCNSEDPPNAAEMGLCRKPDIDYMEIRVFGLNWESAMFEAWLLQIVLSELLDVPATIETGTAEARLNFYHPQGPFEYGDPAQLDAFINAMRPEFGLDCEKASRDPNNYTRCAHFIPELWDAGALEFQEYVENGKVDPLKSLGVIGREGWFVPKFTGMREPSVLSYLGIQEIGDDRSNRHKLADLFRRPTTWKEYCDQVSSNGCIVDDGVAKRPPEDESEEERLFVEGAYTGHFRLTEEGNCTLNPDTCSGVLIDYPCDWGSNSVALLYHLDVPLEAYTSQSYAQMVEIWSAANATKSNVMMMWWSPDYTYQMFQGTDMEMMRVTLPSPTQECVKERLNAEKACEDKERKVGDKIGACDEPPTLLKTAVLSGLYDLSYGPRVPEAIRNPAYDSMSVFSLTSLQLDELFDNWKKMKTPRDAICRWAVDNIDFMQSLVPHTYPRSVEEESVFGPLRCVSMGLGLAVTVVVLLAMRKVYEQRNHRVIRVAQIEFLYLLLAGSLTIAIGSVVSSIPPTNASCVTTTWLINFGYTLELVPMIIKIAAINRLVHAAEEMRRVVLKRRQLFGAVFLISGIVLMYLVIWTSVDRPKKSREYELTELIIDDATIVRFSNYCSPENNIWRLFAVGWNVSLLLSATVLAFQSRNIRQDFNESQTLGILIYSHFVFVVLRTITYFLPLRESDLTLYRSIIFSLDTLATIIIYFVPKFLTTEDPANRQSSSVSGLPALYPPPPPSNSQGFDPNSGRSNRTNRSSHNDIEIAARRKYGNRSEFTSAITLPGTTSEAQRLLEESYMIIAELERKNNELQSRNAWLEERSGELATPQNEKQDTSEKFNNTEKCIVEEYEREENDTAENCDNQKPEKEN